MLEVNLRLSQLSPQIIDALYREMDNLRERQGALARMMVNVIDIEATNSLAIGETHPRVTALEEQVQTLQTALHESRSKNQQLQTTVAEMHSREGTLMQYMQWMEERLTLMRRDFQDRLPGAQMDLVHRNATGGGGLAMWKCKQMQEGPESSPQARDCTFSSFMKCGPTQFHGKEGAIELCRWFEKMESTFGISECAERSKVKFAAATLQGRALTWWNTQVATLGLAEAKR
ncbi:hypothetical protein Tco_0823405 [Tanacetum coccineum]|uniref:Reverse transcriptase domain-containing protein n=1 Tax=Tanacetum coccineum TaxID=301880 RepID=A0ABQ5ALV4_9ASTR